MFLLNLDYRWNLSTELERLQGVIYLPTGSTSERIARAPTAEVRRILLDPQLYLAGLDAKKSTKTCARLATYPWFGVDAPEFDSSAASRKDWENSVRDIIADSWPQSVPQGDGVYAACRSALEFQMNLPCTHLLIPTPLIVEREDEAQSLAEWLDSGLEAAQDLDVGQPLIATVAVAESALNDAASEPAGFLDSIIAQVTAREGLDGVYIVVMQTYARHPFETAALVDGAYLHLSRAFAEQGYDAIITNFACVFGMVCLGVGATGMAIGPSQKLRRLSMSGYDEQKGGLPLPRFYSHKAISEYLPETELGRIMERRCLGRIRDITPYSEGLMEILDNGGSAADVPEWAESKNNCAAAQRHFLHRLSQEARQVSRLTANRRRRQIREWLEEAIGTTLYLERRLSGYPSTGQSAPSENWLELLDESS